MGVNTVIQPNDCFNDFVEIDYISEVRMVQPTNKPTTVFFSFSSCKYLFERRMRENVDAKYRYQFGVFKWDGAFYFSFQKQSTQYKSSQNSAIIISLFDLHAVPHSIAGT